jgi:hypothetical protein
MLMFWNSESSELPREARSRDFSPEATSGGNRFGKRQFDR